MRLKLWQVDAFARHVFEGNPAAVVPLQSWPDDRTLQAIAKENNLAETAFIIANGNAGYDLRWFTPSMEVPMCGHATLASAWVIFSELAPSQDAVHFKTRSGILTVEKSPDGCHRMALPAGRTENFQNTGFAARLAEALSVPRPLELHFAPTGAGGTPGIIAVWNETVLRQIEISDTLAPLLASAGAGGLLATASADSSYDFVSRFFAPCMGVFEDPVTGSMHATLAPFWAERLGKRELHAFQASARGGELHCMVTDGRVILAGPCALYLHGEIEI